MRTVDDLFFIRLSGVLIVVVLAMLAIIFIDEIPGQKPMSIKTHPNRYECTAYDVRDGVCTEYSLKEKTK